MSRWYRVKVDVAPIQDVAGVPADVRPMSAKTVQVVHAGQPGCVLQLQGSVDGVTWVDIGSAFTSPTGGLLNVTQTLRALRVHTDEWIDPVAVSDATAVEVTRFVARVALGPIPHTFVLALAEALLLTEQVVVDLNGVVQDTVVETESPLRKADLFDHLNLGSDDLAVEVDADDVTAAASSVAPSSSLPAVYVAGFDDRAV